MKKIRWLHFSDIHLNKTGVETRRMRHALIPYLRKLQLQCDYVFLQEISVMHQVGINSQML